MVLSSGAVVSISCLRGKDICAEIASVNNYHRSGDALTFAAWFPLTFNTALFKYSTKLEK
jgi:hypothetical protein